MVHSQLQRGNEALAAELVRLGQSNSNDYSQITKQIASNRGLIREMSRASDVPIEPEQQTKLLDAC